MDERVVLDELLRQNAVLAARVDELERRLDGGAPPAPAVVPAPVLASAPVGRRHVLTKGLAAGAAAAAAGTVAALGATSPAAAANGDALRLGAADNSASGSTALVVSGGGASFGLAVTDGFGTRFRSPAIAGLATDDSFDTGVLGSVNDTGTGVIGLSDGTGTGIYAYSESGVALRASSETTQLRIQPNNRLEPPSDTLLSDQGSLRWTGNAFDGALWACITGGAPGSWRKVVGTGTAGAFHLLPSPVRVYDSRPGTNPSQGPKTKLPAGNVARTIDLKHNTSGVPAGATGVLLTVLLVNAAVGNGNVTVWANDKPKPLSNTMVWGGNLGRFTATTTTAVDAQARVKVDASLTTDLVLDVVGFYR